MLRPPTQSSLPYQEHSFTTECPRRITNKNDNKHSNSNSTGFKLDDPKDLKLLYLIMTHEKPMQTVRLVSALEDLGHTFIIHVDAKAKSEDTQNFLKEVRRERAKQEATKIQVHPSLSTN